MADTCCQPTPKTMLEKSCIALRERHYSVLIFKTTLHLFCVLLTKKYAAGHTKEICIPQLSPHDFFLTHKFRHGFQAWWIENNVLFVWVCTLSSRRGLSDCRFLNENQKRSFGNGQHLLLHSLWLNIWDSQRTLEKGISSKQDFAGFFHRKSNTKNKNGNRVENDQKLCCVHLSCF